MTKANNKQIKKIYFKVKNAKQQSEALQGVETQRTQSVIFF